VWLILRISRDIFLKKKIRENLFLQWCWSVFFSLPNLNLECTATVDPENKREILQSANNVEIQFWKRCWYFREFRSNSDNKFVALVNTFSAANSIGG
jgi:hypothetical protein